LKESYTVKRRQKLSTEQIAQNPARDRVSRAGLQVGRRVFFEGVLDLVVVCAYVAKLLRNDEIAKLLNFHYQEIGDTLKNVMAAASPEQDVVA
jgi:hypothetical protein